MRSGKDYEQLLARFARSFAMCQRAGVPISTSLAVVANAVDNAKVVKTDVERGLIMIQGSGPGSKGAWIMIKDAVKKPAPANAAFPGSFEAAAAGEAK